MTRYATPRTPKAKTHIINDKDLPWKGGRILTICDWLWLETDVIDVTDEPVRAVCAHCAARQWKLDRQQGA